MDKIEGSLFDNYPEFFVVDSSIIELVPINGDGKKLPCKIEINVIPLLHVREIKFIIELRKTGDVVDENYGNGKSFEGMLNFPFKNRIAGVVFRKGRSVEEEEVFGCIKVR